MVQARLAQLGLTSTSPLAVWAGLRTFSTLARQLQPLATNPQSWRASWPSISRRFSIAEVPLSVIWARNFSSALGIDARMLRYPLFRGTAPRSTSTAGIHTLVTDALRTAQESAAVVNARRTAGTRPSARQVHTTGGSGPELPFDRQAAIGAYETMENAFHAARKSTSDSKKIDFIERQVGKYFSSIAAAGVKVDSALVADMLNRLSYLEIQRPGARPSFTVNIQKDSLGILGLRDGQSAKVRFERVDHHVDRLGFDELRLRPRGVPPGTAFDIWKASTGGQSQYGVIFRGTNSVGRIRDGSLTHEDATGALSNGASGEIGKGVVANWLLNPENPLRKYADRIRFVGGHSLGAVFGQQFIEQRLAQGADAPFAYLASAPSLSARASEAWHRFKDRFLFVHNSQDPVTAAGVRSFPGRQLVARALDLPLQLGLGDSRVESATSAHGPQPATLLTLRGDQLELTERRETPDWRAFLWAGADKLRPTLAPMLFRENAVEEVMRHFEHFGIDRLLQDPKAATAGADYAYTVHLARHVLSTELGRAAFNAGQEATLRTIVAKRDQVLADPQAGLNAIARALVENIDFTYLPKNDIQGAREAIDALVRQAKPKLEGSD